VAVALKGRPRDRPSARIFVWSSASRSKCPEEILCLLAADPTSARSHWLLCWLRILEIPIRHAPRPPTLTPLSMFYVGFHANYLDTHKFARLCWNRLAGLGSVRAFRVMPTGIVVIAPQTLRSSSPGSVLPLSVPSPRLWSHYSNKRDGRHCEYEEQGVWANHGSRSMPTRLSGLG